MDSELLSLCPPPPPLAYSLPLTSSLTLSTKTGLAFLADSHQRTRRVIWLYMSKRVWLSLGNVLFIRWGLDAALPLFLICWQNKPVRQHNTEHVANSHTCISVHFYFDPITFAPKNRRGWLILPLSIFRTNNCSVITVPSQAFGRNAAF